MNRRYLFTIIWLVIATILVAFAATSMAGTESFADTTEAGAEFDYDHGGV